MEKRSFKYLVAVVMYFFYRAPYKNLVTFKLVDTIMNPEDRFDSLHFYFYGFE